MQVLRFEFQKFRILEILNFHPCTLIWLNLTLCILMDFPIHINTVSMGLPIVLFKGSQVEFSML